MSRSLSSSTARIAVVACSLALAAGPATSRVRGTREGLAGGGARCIARAVAFAVPAVAPAAAAGGLEFLPEDEHYPRYLADPLQSRFGFAFVEVTDEAVADSGGRRAYLQLGGVFGLLGVGEAASGRRWQLAIEAGFNGIFDIEEDYDNVGWDGIYGLWWSRGDPRRTVLRAGLRHISSHIGDELIERTGRERLEYTREEVAVGLSRTVVPSWRLYAEGAWAYVTRNEELQEPLRLQAGIERQFPLPVGGERLRGYAALDVQSFEERDWDPDLSLQLGLARPSGVRRWRLGLELRHGRVPVGELFRNQESSAMIGVWLDP